MTFDEAGGRAPLTFHELYPSKDALDQALARTEGGMPEQFDRLDELLFTLCVGAAGS